MVTQERENSFPFPGSVAEPPVIKGKLTIESWSSNILATWYEELIHWKRPWCWDRLKARGEGDDRGWDGWMASPTQWTWIWASSGSWWWTGKPGALQFMGSQRVGHDWMTKQEKKKKKERSKHKFNNFSMSWIHGRDPGKQSHSLKWPSLLLGHHLKLKMKEVEVGVPRKSSVTKKWSPLQSQPPPSQVMSVSCDYESSAAWRRGGHDKRRLPSSFWRTSRVSELLLCLPFLG